MRTFIFFLAMAAVAAAQPGANYVLELPDVAVRPGESYRVACRVPVAAQLQLTVTGEGRSLYTRERGGVPPRKWVEWEMRTPHETSLDAWPQRVNIALTISNAAKEPVNAIFVLQRQPEKSLRRSDPLDQFDRTGFDPNPAQPPKSTSGILRFWVGVESDVNISIVPDRRDAQPVYKNEERNLGRGSHRHRWDLKGAKGVWAPSGRYVAIVRCIERSTKRWQDLQTVLLRIE
ncbi:MAG: hypothetical protein WD696_14910 [Bryobacteraceae bacterium]